MAELRTYRDLLVWQKAMELAEQVYALSVTFPPDERFGLTSQLRRAAVSVPANIAEGYGRNSRGEYLQHLGISRGSLRETETLLLLSERLKLTADATASLRLADEVGALLWKLEISLRPRKK